MVNKYKLFLALAMLSLAGLAGMSDGQKLYAALPVPSKNLASAEAHAYKEVSEGVELPLYILRPSSAGDAKKPAYVLFFGGGWVKGAPGYVYPLAKALADAGFVVVLPDYRTKERAESNPVDSVADARDAYAWVYQNAEELGIEQTRIAVGGMSAGGHLAIWTAIRNPQNSSQIEAMTTPPPAALALLFPVTDTTLTGYAGGVRTFGESAIQVNVFDQLPQSMPPTLILHGDQDSIVPYANSERLAALLESNGNSCTLRPLVGKNHGIRGRDEWPPVITQVREFLLSQLQPTEASE